MRACIIFSVGVFVFPFTCLFAAKAYQPPVALPVSFLVLSRRSWMIAIVQQFYGPLPQGDTIEKRSEGAAAALVVRPPSISQQHLSAPVFREISTRAEFSLAARRSEASRNSLASFRPVTSVPPLGGSSRFEKASRDRLRLRCSGSPCQQPVSPRLAFALLRHLLVNCFHPACRTPPRHFFSPSSTLSTVARPGQSSTFCLDRCSCGSRNFAGRVSPLLLDRSPLPQLHKMATTQEAQGKVLAELSQAGYRNGWRSADVRNAYLEFFNVHGHLIYPSSPVVPHGDNTLLFINAGMNQFKPIFLGKVDRNSPLGKLRRVVDTQKCIRAGGKHNDLEDVGKDVYHHTFFEMLGNWSFGDYFKKEAIQWAWQLLTGVYKIPKDRLYASYFGGDPRLPACPPDEEARALWLQYLPADRVLPFGAKENFWEMADTGPCGPCSEIHYDRIGGRDAASLVNADDPSVLEIWNLVFMQYNRESDGSLTPLPAPCVDTGMGLERLVSVLQDKQSNYDTDLFMALFDKIRELTPGLRPYEGRVGDADVDRTDMAYRVLADHARCLTAAISDGAEPSNEGRGYVLRRILRRAVRFARQTLGMKEGCFAELVPVVVSRLGDTFPEMRRNEEKVMRTIQREEQQFSRTLDKGVERFKKVCGSLQTKSCTEFPGSEAFTLYSTYGFPLDLTELMAEEVGLKVDTDEFNRKFEAHRVASENTTFKQGGAGAVYALPPEHHHVLAKTRGISPTDEKAKYTWNVHDQSALLTVSSYSRSRFIVRAGPCKRGMQDEVASAPIKGKVMAIWDGKRFAVDVTPCSAQEERLVAIILDKTCFYAEQGGQVGDVGRLVDLTSGAEFEVVDSQKSGDYVLHIGSVCKGEIKEGDELVPLVDYARRFKLAQHHTGTHLLNFALREVLSGKSQRTEKREEAGAPVTNGTEDRGDIQQRGSLVEERRLRFDYDGDKPLDNNDIIAIETVVKDCIGKALRINHRDVPLQVAMKIPGLRAVFGEVYPDPVRVVAVGPEIDDLLRLAENGVCNGQGPAASIELCGGTHLHNSKQLE
ncbi:cytosolic trna-ala synthetase, partial [Cystoisospora suis]